MKKTLLYLSFFTLASFSVNAQTETTIDDFNYTVTDPFSLEQIVATLAHTNGTDWAMTNKAHWINGMGLTAATATNTAGKAGFAVGEKTITSTVYSRTSGKGPSGANAKDEINNEIGFNVNLKLNNTYKIKFDISPMKKITYDIISVELLDKTTKSKVITLYTKQFSSTDYGKKTILVDIPTSVTANEYILNFRHTVTAIDVNSQLPSTDIQGGLILDKIIIVNKEEVMENETFSLSSIVVYPNPATDLITVSNVNEYLISFKMFDANGRTIKNSETIFSSTISIYVTDVPIGIYFLEIETASGKIVKKIMKQ